MDFYERVKILAKEKKKPIISLLQDLGINYDSYKSSKRLGNLPRADEAVKLAKSLGTTVEYLVLGDEAQDEIAKSEPTKYELLLDNLKMLIAESESSVQK